VPPSSSTPPAAEPRVVRQLYGLLRPYRRTVYVGIACLVLSVCAELAPPIVWKYVIDVGLPRRDWGYIGGQLALLVALLGAQQALSAVRGVLLERAGQQLTLDLRVRLYQKLQGQSAAYFADRRTGDLIARLTADVEGVQDVIIRGTDSVVANALRIVIVAAVFITLQPLLGVLVLTPMLAVGVLLVRYNRRVKPVYQAARAAVGGLSAKIAENLGGIRVIQGFAQEDRELAATRELGQRIYDQQVAAVRLRNRVFPAVRFVGQLGNVTMLAGGVWLILRGEFTLGGLLAYRGYGRYFYGPIDDLVSISDLLQRASASGRRLFEVLDAPDTVADARDATPLPVPLRGEIALRSVSFGYDPARPVLHGIDLHVSPGQRVALVGPSGSGKSTLLGLLWRAYDPTAGRVCVDGRDLRGATLASLRSQVAQVQQDTFLFNGTVADNLRYGRPDATDAEVEAAARAANAHEFVTLLPEGYQTQVGERGTRLSGGQKQRLAIARALVAAPRILLLDEPTSAVDPESEGLIVEALTALPGSLTTLVVTHRLSLARTADRVLVLVAGRIVEDGPPATLLANPDGPFAVMHREEGVNASV
jgi:ABC-type multidrug transport system fused ATPase/permease subunit